MGREIKTTLRFDGRILEGLAALDGESLVFRGDVSLTVPFSEIFGVESSGGWLDLKTSRGLMLLELGGNAAGWAERIKNPKALADKLGLSAGKKVAVVGKLDGDLLADIEASGAKVAKGARGKDFDAVFLAAKTKKDLERVAALRASIKDDGALWIVHATDAKDLVLRDVLTAGRTQQLTDQKKPLSITDTTIAVCFVIPPALRKKR